MMTWIGSRLNDLLFHLVMVVLLVLLAWLSSRYDNQWDWTHQGSNSLNPISIEILQRTPGELSVTAYVGETAKLRDRIQRFVARYQRHKPNIELTFIDPLRHPDEARRQGISLSGEIVLRHMQREERIQKVDEEQFSNAILRLSRDNAFWIAGLSGHGERDLTGRANHDLGEFGKSLKQQGYQIAGLDLATTPSPPDNTALLLIASPVRPLLSGEIERISDYISGGGNLLIMSDPGNWIIEDLIQQLFAIEQLPGTIVDASGKALGIDNPAVAVVPEYPDHAATQGFNLLTLFPQSAALSATEQMEWKTTPLLQTLDKSWNETGPLSGEIERDPLAGEEAGPLTIGIALSRQHAEKQQRILIIGDGDFLANSYLNNAGNLDLGLSLCRWLVGDDQLIGIPAPQASDQELHLSRLAIGTIGLGSLIVLPLLLLLTGSVMGWRRNRA
ncbi:GldG family protein [Candidatus Thiodiazotropha sp. CDECU1]|uniref:GldG family protein n=1 Tax=Candidatus Thiodiazotropha sp. CDECU1 TaxID=3065865 RepID=UPI002930A042|nr:GldG family protein [Candidatus Thiodiazotropha sp. CDECU1]